LFGGLFTLLSLRTAVEYRSQGCAPSLQPLVGQYRLSVLMVLFAVWDLSPFAGLFVAGIVSKRWRILMRAALYAVMLFVAGESVVVYARVVLKRPAQPAFAFLMVPLVSWALLIVVLLIAHVVSTKRAGHQPLFRA
jgi:hypothetical protein